MTPERNSALLALVCILLTIVLRAAATQNATKMLPELAVQITDYAALPMTGSPDGTGNNAGSDTDSASAPVRTVMPSGSDLAASVPPRHREAGRLV